MLIRRFFHVFCNEAGDGSGAGASSGGAGDAGSGSGAAGASGGDGAGVAASDGATGSTASGSALGAGAVASTGAAGGQSSGTDPLSWLPEKHRDFGEDGKTLNLEASARKVAEAYGHAEKRIGSGDLPPKSADEYKVNVPEALAEKIKAEELAGNPDFKEMLSKAHAEGLTQKQVDFVVGEFLDRSLKLQQGVNQLSEQDCVAALRENWKTDQEYTANVQAAYRAGQAYGDIDKLMGKYGNDPDFIRFAANVGKELAEDRSAPAGAQALEQADLESLTKSKAYMDPTHPDHLATKQKVQAHFERSYGGQAKRGGPVVITT